MYTKKYIKTDLKYFFWSLFGGLLCGFMIFLFGGSQDLQFNIAFLGTAIIWFEIRFRRILGILK